MADFNQATSNPVALSTPVTIPSVGQSINATAAGIVSIFEQIAFDASISGKLMGSVTGQTVRAGGFVMPTVGQLWELGIPMQGITAPVRTTDVDAAAQIDRIEAAEAVTLSNPVRAAINQLVVDLKAAGVYSKIRYMMLSIGMPTIAGCRVPFKDNFLNYAQLADSNPITGYNHDPAKGVRFPQGSGLQSPSSLTALQVYGPGPVRSDVSLFLFYTSPGAVSGGTGFSSIIYGPDDFPSTRGFFLGMANSNSTANFNRYENSGQPISGFLPEPNHVLFLGTMSGANEAWLHRNTWSTSNVANNQFSDSLADPVSFRQISEVASGQESLRIGAAGYGAAMTETEARAFQTALQNYRLAIAAATVGEEPVVYLPFLNNANDHAGRGVGSSSATNISFSGGYAVFNGSSSFLKIGPDSYTGTLLDLVSGSPDFTIELYFRRSATQVGRIFTQQEGAPAVGAIILACGGAVGNDLGGAILGAGGASIGSVTAAGAITTLNVEYKVALELVGATLRLYLNDSLVAQSVLSGSRVASPMTGGTWIGRISSGSENFAGSMREYKVWRSARYAPKLTPHRYWRFVDIVIPGGGFLEISELRLYRYGLQNSSGTISSSSAPVNGVASLADNNLGTSCYWTEAVVENPAFWIKFSFASAVEINGVAQGGKDNPTRHMDSFTLQYSDDDTNWTTLGTKTGLTYPGNSTLSSVYSF